jgi:hypothetical protein
MTFCTMLGKEFFGLQMSKEGVACDVHGPLWKWRGRLRCKVCREWIPKRSMPRKAWQLVNLTVAEKRGLLRAFSECRSARVASRAMGLDPQKVERFLRVTRAVCLLDQAELNPVGKGSQFLGRANSVVLRWRRAATRVGGPKSLLRKQVVAGPSGPQEYVCIRLQTTGQRVSVSLAGQRDARRVFKHMGLIEAHMKPPCPLIYENEIARRTRASGIDGWSCIPYKSFVSKLGKMGTPAASRAWAFIPQAADRSSEIMRPSKSRRERSPNHLAAFWRYATWILSIYRAVPLPYLHLYLAEAAWKYNHRSRLQPEALEKLMRGADGHSLQYQAVTL